MRKYLSHLLITLLIATFHQVTFSQTYENSSPILDKSLFQNEDHISNESVQIPLYTINLDGINLPIFLSYNNRGIKVSDIPSSAGMNWHLNAGGNITRDVRGIPDEYKGMSYLNPEPSDIITGLFHDNLKLTDYAGVYYQQSAIEGHQFSTYHDSSSDIYNFSVSNGDRAAFMFKQIQTGTPSPTSQYQFETVYLGKNQNYKLDINYTDLVDSQCIDCEDFTITSDAGLEYTLRKGPVNEVPFLYFSNPGHNGPLSERNYYSHKDFYIKEIKSKYNTDNILFSYIESPYIIKAELLANIRASNTDVHNGTVYASSSDYWEDILIKQSDRLELEQITTQRERIEFEYVDFQYYLWSGQIYNQQDTFDKVQNIKLINKIKIYDFNNNLIGGYRFHYFNTQGGGGKPFLDKIERIGSDGISTELYRDFEYYDPDYLSHSLSPSQDALGFSNNAYSNGLFDDNGYRNITPMGHKYIHTPPRDRPIPVLVEPANRLPDVESLKAGILKSIITKYKGKTEFNYKINQSDMIYYGGILVENIKEYDTDGSLLLNKKYEYYDVNGFGIPLGSNTECQFDMNRYFMNLIDQPEQNNTLFNLSNFPIEFYDTGTCNAPTPNNLSEHQKFGNFYERVVIKNLDVTQTAEVSNGYIVNHFEPTYGYFYRSKLMSKNEIFNSQDILISKSEYDYQEVIKDYFTTIKYDNNHNNTGSCSLTNDPFLVQDPLYGEICISGHYYKFELDEVYSLDYILREKNETNYNDDGTTANNKSKYYYLNDTNSDVDRNRTKRIEYYFNSEPEPFRETQFMYLSELNNIPSGFDNLLEYSNPKVQTTDWDIINNQHILNNTSINEFYIDGKLKNAFVLSKANSNNIYDINTYVNPFFDGSGVLQNSGIPITSLNYDALSGKLISKIQHLSSLNTYYQRSSDYNEIYVDAVLHYKGIVTNPNSIFTRKSFEDSTLSGVVFFDNAISGDYVYSNSSINLGSFPGNSLITYWEYKNGTWDYKEQDHNGGSVQINLSSGAQYLDEIRVFPKDGLVTSQTFKPLIGKQSKISTSNTVIKNHYDVFNRIQFVTDQNNNLIKETNYNTIND